MIAADELKPIIRGSLVFSPARTTRNTNGYKYEVLKCRWVSNGVYHERSAMTRDDLEKRIDEFLGSDQSEVSLRREKSELWHYLLKNTPGQMSVRRIFDMGLDAYEKKVEVETGVLVPLAVEAYLDAMWDDCNNLSGSHGALVAMDAYLTNFVKPYLNCRFSELNDYLLNAWFRGLNQKPEALVHLRTYFKGFLKWAQDNELIENISFDLKIPENQKRAEILSSADLREIINKWPKKDIMPLLVVAFCGCRLEEVSQLTLEHLYNDFLVIETEVAGGKDVRRIPVSSNLQDWISIINHINNKVRPTDLIYNDTNHSLWHYLARTAKALGFELKAATLRNSFASYRLAITHDIRVTARELGVCENEMSKLYHGLAKSSSAIDYFDIRPE